MKSGRLILTQNNRNYPLVRGILPAVHAEMTWPRGMCVKPANSSSSSRLTLGCSLKLPSNVPPLVQDERSSDKVSMTMQIDSTNVNEKLFYAKLSHGYRS